MVVIRKTMQYKVTEAGAGPRLPVPNPTWAPYTWVAFDKYSIPAYLSLLRRKVKMTGFSS